ncbi:hypothetical protein RM533_13140 [Croceicoccus sp. F390]|uniref:NADH:flavin oxidoreductase/NADH oxidase N-terminal domain-containing protein n=1 Tax=Croceicoccus esteveae TaxID=3075597 RepID=A0ABU2ZL46_9SPHN|nr:hypothetical protein [Croceicoccus sp. F390]MDT0577111.1 hypothetical protein [Croceicoccus sp. F390]
MTIAVGSIGLADLFTEEQATARETTLPGVSPEHLKSIAAQIDKGDFDLIAVGRSLLADANWAAKLRDEKSASWKHLTAPR